MQYGSDCCCSTELAEFVSIFCLPSPAQSCGLVATLDTAYAKVVECERATGVGALGAEWRGTEGVGLRGADEA